MTKLLLTTACIIALTSAGVMAQTNGPVAQRNLTDAPKTQMGKDNKMTTGSSTTDKRGDSKGMQPSGGANTNNMGSQAGGGAGGGSGGGK